MRNITILIWRNFSDTNFIASCKKGVKPQKQVLDNGVKEWFEWARSKRIVIAMSGEIAYTPDGEPVSLQEMMYLYPMR